MVCQTKRKIVIANLPDPSFCILLCGFCVRRINAMHLSPRFGLRADVRPLLKDGQRLVLKVGSGHSLFQTILLLVQGCHQLVKIIDARL